MLDLGSWDFSIPCCDGLCYLFNSYLNYLFFGFCQTIYDDITYKFNFVNPFDIIVTPLTYYLKIINTNTIKHHPTTERVIHLVSFDPILFWGFLACLIIWVCSTFWWRFYCKVDFFIMTIWSLVFWQTKHSCLML